MNVGEPGAVACVTCGSSYLHPDGSALLVRHHSIKQLYAQSDTGNQGRQGVTLRSAGHQSTGALRSCLGGAPITHPTMVPGLLVIREPAIRTWDPSGVVACCEAHTSRDEEHQERGEPRVP